MDEPDLPLDQASHRNWMGKEDVLGVVEQKLNAKINGQNKNMIHWTLLCGNGSPITEEETPQQTVAGKAMPEQSLPMEEQKQQMHEDQPREISSCPYKEGRDYDWEMSTSPFPKERIQTDNKPSICFSSCCSQETREAEFPTISRTMTGICGNPGQRASKPPGCRTVKNDADRKQPLGKEAQIGNETERKVDKELRLHCPKGKESETDGSLLSAEDPPSRGENDDRYNYIEDFLSEGALVSIDSVQTYVDLKTGTIQTSVEVSAEDEGVAVRHKVEWVTQFEQSRKLK